MRRIAVAFLVALLAASLPSASASGCIPRRWTKGAPVPTSRTEVAAAAYEGKIYVAGGFGASGPSDAVDVFDRSIGEWAAGPRLPIPLNHAMAVRTPEGLLVTGGYVSVTLGGVARPTAVPSARAFMFRDGAWTEVRAMPEPRAAGGAAYLGGQVYVVGGTNADDLAQDSLVYDLATDTWTTAPGLPQPREHLAAAASGGFVYAIGGRTGGLTTNLATVDALDTSTGAWVDAPDLPRPRGGLAAAALKNGAIVAVGGEAPGAAFADADMLRPGARKWVPLPDLRTARHGLGVVALGNVVFALAGGPEPNLSHSDANESLILGRCRR